MVYVDRNDNLGKNAEFPWELLVRRPSRSLYNLGLMRRMFHQHPGAYSWISLQTGRLVDLPSLYLDAQMLLVCVSRARLNSAESVRKQYDSFHHTSYCEKGAGMAGSIPRRPTTAPSTKAHKAITAIRDKSPQGIRYALWKRQIKAPREWKQFLSGCVRFGQTTSSYQHPSIEGPSQRSPKRQQSPAHWQQRQDFDKESRTRPAP